MRWRPRAPPLAGEGDRRTGGRPGVVRWGQQRGSVALADQQLPITYRRVRDRARNTEVPLTTYQQLQIPRGAAAGRFRTIRRGVSCRADAEGAEAVPAAFGLSPSTVSRRCSRVSARALRRLCERRLDRAACRARVRDGNTFAEDAMIIALGITLAGQKVLRGFVQTATENEAVCAAVLRALVERGRHIEDGLLVGLNGANGLRRAVATVWGAKALVQRCQWHTREHVVRSLPTRHQVTWRRTLQAAYARPTSPDAQAALLRLRTELGLRNASAVGSLDEGVEETLTRHRFGLVEVLGRSLTTTNCLESLMAQVGQVTDTVARWRTSDQQPRWVASALLAIEPRLRRIKGYQGPDICPSFGLSYSERRRIPRMHEIVAYQPWDPASEFQRTMGLTPLIPLARLLL